jgi:hypothetical protein
VEEETMGKQENKSRLISCCKPDTLS